VADGEKTRKAVNYAFYKADAAWKRLSRQEKDAGKREFIDVVERYEAEVVTQSYSTVGMRSDVDFMLWRIAPSLDLIQEMSAALNATALGGFLNTPYGFLAMTKASAYIDKHVHPGQEGRRLDVIPTDKKYIFVYPFVKTREWYHLTGPTRQGMMNEHIEIGHRYPSVKLNTAYSFGLDDQEFMVSFETDSPSDFLDLVQELRGSAASLYTLRDTPIFTCRKRSLEECLDYLG
jgi:chlorite dismutase